MYIDQPTLDNITNLLKISKMLQMGNALYNVKHLDDGRTMVLIDRNIGDEIDTDYINYIKGIMALGEER